MGGGFKVFLNWVNTGDQLLLSPEFSSIPGSFSFHPIVSQSSGLGPCFHLSVTLGDLTLSQHQATHFAPSAWVASVQLSIIPASSVDSLW